MTPVHFAAEDSAYGLFFVDDTDGSRIARTISDDSLYVPGVGETVQLSGSSSIFDTESSEQLDESMNYDEFRIESRRFSYIIVSADDDEWELQKDTIVNIAVLEVSHIDE